MSSNLYDSVVLIHSKNEKNKTIGTGFIIHQDKNKTYLLTCYHVVKEVDGPENVMAEGIPATMIASDGEDGFDLAVLVVEDENLQNQPTLKLSSLCEKRRLFFGAGYWLEAGVKTMTYFSGIIHQKRRIWSKKLEKHTDAWGLTIDPENTLKDGNSGSPVVDLQSKFVVGVVTTKAVGKKAGEKGSAVSIDALKEIWEDMPKELISSDANVFSLSDLSNDTQNGLVFPLSNPVIVGVLALLVISIVSLLGSYILYSSEPWHKAYKEYGWVIEIFRSVFLILEGLFLIRPYFSQEFCEFFGFFRPKQQNKKLLLSIRLLTLTGFIAACSYLFAHHFNIGPRELKERTLCLLQQKKIDQGQLKGEYEDYYVPYQWYLPYSCITYIILILPTISIAIYSIVKDLFVLIKYKIIFGGQIKKISSLGSDDNITDFIQEELGKLIEKIFDYFRDNFLNIIKRYIILFLVVSFVFSYEFLVGHLTLSIRALMGFSVAMTVIVVALFIILLGYLHYEDAYQQGSKSIKNISPNLFEHFQSNNNSRSFFLQEIFRQFYGLSIGIVLIAFSLIIFLIVKVVFPDSCLTSTI